MRALLLAGAVAAMACGRPAGTGPPAGGAGPDSLRGTVSVVGSEPATSVAIQTGDGRAFTLLGERPALDRLAGLEVAVWGVAAGPVPSLPREGFRVERFAVRASDGVPAVDGVVQPDGTLLTAEGHRQALTGLSAYAPGTRLWVVADAAGRVSVHGVIAQAGDSVRP
jgi:hypothetical protein